MRGWLKFTGDNWDAYMLWPAVADAIRNCTPTADSTSRHYISPHSNNVCWDKLNCALTAANPRQQAQYSTTATILGLVSAILSEITLPMRSFDRLESRANWVDLSVTNCPVVHGYIIERFTAAAPSISSSRSAPFSLQSIDYTLRSYPSQSCKQGRPQPTSSSKYSFRGLFFYALKRAVNRSISIHGRNYSCTSFWE